MRAFRPVQVEQLGFLLLIELGLLFLSDSPDSVFLTQSLVKVRLPPLFSKSGFLIFFPSIIDY